MHTAQHICVCREVIHTDTHVVDIHTVETQCDLVRAHVCEVLTHGVYIGSSM